MNKHPSSDPTVGYYDKNALVFSESTRGVDMSHLYAEFLPLVPKGGKILDAGCGSGRDAVFFKKLGYSLSAFDASAELAALASQSLGEPVRVSEFRDLDARGEFDGVWACASLLHVPVREIDGVLNRITAALKTGGHFYASFKYGSREREEGGRFFNDYDEIKLHSLLTKHPSLSPLKIWQTHDARPERQSERWLNAILKKTEN